MRKAFWGCLKEQRAGIGMYLLMVLIFFAVSGLNHLENSKELFYAVVLTGFCGILFLVFRFYRYFKQFLFLREMESNLEEAANLLTLPEGQYQKLLISLSKEWMDLREKTSVRETEMSDYYMLWAHQIKTPIAAMRLLLQDSDNFALREELFKIEQYAEMALHYIRINSMASDMILKEYELYDMVKQALKKYAVLFINGKVRLHLADFTCKVLTDEKWCSFLLEQILSNAVKYTKQGEITIYMEESIPEALVIADTGIGIRPEDLPRIFDRGFTGYNGRMDKKSTGIGLYLCKQIAERLMHEITVVSMPQQGTKVSISFHRNDYNK